MEGITDHGIDIEEKLPLLVYACNYWYLHVRICEGFMPEWGIRLVKEFLEYHERMAFFENGIYSYIDRAADSGCHLTRCALMRSDSQKGRISTSQMRIDQGFAASFLYYIARLSLGDGVKALLKETSSIHSSLNWAMSQRLISRTFGDELRVVYFYNHEGVMEILLNAGVDSEAIDGAFKTPLGAYMQSDISNPGIIQMLLDRHEEISPDDDWISG